MLTVYLLLTLLVIASHGTPPHKPDKIKPGKPDHKIFDNDDLDGHKIVLSETGICSHKFGDKYIDKLSRKASGTRFFKNLDGTTDVAYCHNRADGTGVFRRVRRIYRAATDKDKEDMCDVHCAHRYGNIGCAFGQKGTKIGLLCLLK